MNPDEQPPEEAAQDAPSASPSPASRKAGRVVTLVLVLGLLGALTSFVYNLYVHALPASVRVVVPAGFRGGLEIQIENDGIAVEAGRDGVYEIRFPESGSIKLKKRSFLFRGQVAEARFSDGSPLVYAPDAPGYGGDVALYDFGYDHRNGHDRLLYFVGSRQEEMDARDVFPEFATGHCVRPETKGAPDKP